MWARIRDCFKPPPSVDIEESIFKIKEVTSLLQQQISKYDSETNMAMRQLRLSITNKESKRAQIYYLKKKKLLEHHLNSASKRLLALNQQQLNLESIKMTALHFETIKQTTHTLQTYMKQTDVDKVEEMADSLAEYIAESTDIQNILTQDVSGLDFDDSELEAELYQLETGDILLPIVPTHRPPQLSDGEDDDTTVSSPLIPVDMG
jgi:hypothetical protein